jgi:hypothetical protein
MAYTFRFKVKDFKDGEMIEADPTTWGDACWAKEKMEEAGIACSDIYLFEEEENETRTH